MILASMVVTATLIFALSVPLAAGRVAPNRWYGFRTPRTVADERVWYPVNRMAGRNGIVLAVLLAGFGLFTALFGVTAWAVIALAIASLAGVISTFISAAGIVAEVDRAGPVLDTRSSFQQTRDREKSVPDREALLRKLGERDR